MWFYISYMKHVWRSARCQGVIMRGRWDEHVEELSEVLRCDLPNAEVKLSRSLLQQLFVCLGSKCHWRDIEQCRGVVWMLFFSAEWHSMKSHTEEKSLWFPSPLGYTVLLTSWLFHFRVVLQGAECFGHIDWKAIWQYVWRWPLLFAMPKTPCPLPLESCNKSSPPLSEPACTSPRILRKKKEWAGDGSD